MNEIVNNVGKLRPHYFVIMSGLDWVECSGTNFPFPAMDFHPGNYREYLKILEKGINIRGLLKNQNS